MMPAVLVVLGSLGLAFALVGGDYQAAQVTMRIVQERDAEVQRRDTVLRPRRPADCDRIGKQYVAWRNAGDTYWTHDCVDARLGLADVPPTERGRP